MVKTRSRLGSSLLLLALLVLAGNTTLPGIRSVPVRMTLTRYLPAITAAPSPLLQEATVPVPDGLPVENAAVVTNCVRCHAMDDAGRMTRISYMRKTPEGWQTSVRRMVMLNDVNLDPEAAREIVRYLADHHGLAPEEARPGLFEAERRMIEYTYEADADTERACVGCHSLGRVITQRRTEEEWELLVATHRGYYPLADGQGLRHRRPQGREASAESRPQDKRQPMEKAIAHLSNAFQLEAPEWSAWAANMRPARLEGSWLLSGYESGKGPIYGRVIVHPTDGTGNEFTTRARLVYAQSGREIVRRGRAVVYTGFQWRGRSFESGADANDNLGLREVMFVERDWQSMSGRWFTGAYDEIGTDVRLRRDSGRLSIAGVFPHAFQAGTAKISIAVHGVNFPKNLEPDDLDFGGGVQVTGLVSSSNRLDVQISVAADAAIGTRDLFVAGVPLQEAVVVHHGIDAIFVVPGSGMARVGGIVFPKQLQQFVAHGRSLGPDRKPGTEDDLDLGNVPVNWSLEEYSATYDEDDVRFVGTLDDNGLFTPSIDGPNADRSGNRNNIGDVWAVATYVGDKTVQPLRARAHLLVTVPVYMRWDSWRVSQ